MTISLGYSAGLINYFFRGKLAVDDVNDDGDQIEIDVENDSGVANVLRNGTFTFYYEAQDGTRKPSPVISGGRVTAAGLADRAEQTLTIQKPSDVDMTQDTPYIIVFRGTIGYEEGIAAIVSAPALSGFVVSPNYTPADGIPGNRLVYRQNGQWKLSPRQGVQAGNIDWKGWYVNGRPTRVLSWSGPMLRYFPNPDPILVSDYLFSSTLYQNGAVFAVAPAAVLGAALSHGAQHPWLVALCTDGSSDIVYRRPAKASDSYALYDPATNPDGWQEIARFPFVGNLQTLTPWFFNGDGTQAQTLRLVNDASMLGGKGMHRFMITVNGASATRADLGNRAGFTYKLSSPGAVYEPPPPLNQTACSGTYTGDSGGHWSETGTDTGDYVVAVDYRDNSEILAIATSQGSTRGKETLISQQTSTWDDCSKDYNTATSAGSSSRTKTYDRVLTQALSFDGINTPLWIEKTHMTHDADSSFSSTSVWANGKVVEYQSESHYTESYDRTQYLEIGSLVYLDLRADMVVMKWNRYHDEYRGSRDQQEPVVPWINVTFTIDELFRLSKPGDSTLIHSDRQNGSAAPLTDVLSPADDAFVVGIATAGPFSNQIGPQASYLPIIDTLGNSSGDDDAAWAVDAGDRLFGSFMYHLYQPTASINYFNYLTGANPATVIPGGGPDATYIPVGLVH
ncbi:MAG: hypothetical protein ACYDDO_13390 [Acidiferrobacterales bacterium]